MSNIITARDPYIIAAEINFIKDRTKELVEKIVVEAEIEIGGKLCEAKSMVPHGEWGNWLLKNVEYQQSTAENLMNIYKEYGTGQIRMGDTWRNSETFKKLTYTQHLALLKIPYEERQEFAEENNVSEMSTRQLQQAIRERDEARQRQEELERNVELLEAQNRNANQEVLNMQQQLAAAQSTDEAWKEQITRLTSERDTAETNEEKLRKEIDQLEAAKHLAEVGEKNAVKEAEVLKSQLKDIQKKQREMRAELKKAKENPDIPEATMEQLRREAEAVALDKAAGDIQKQLDAANAALAAEQEKTRAIEEKLVAAQRKSDPELVECNVMAQKLRADFRGLINWIVKISVSDKAKSEKMLEQMRRMVKAWAEALGMEVKA